MAGRGAFDMLGRENRRWASYRIRSAFGQFLGGSLPEQRLVFTITNGRSGSARLAELLDRLDGVTAEHEPKPRFETLMHDVAANPGLARKFLLNVKLPAIAKVPCTTYVETSHVFGKGYFEAMMDLDIPFSLILLRRDLRAIALSMLRLNTVPGRTPKALQYYLLPSEAQHVVVPDPARLSDYQMCYWHACEMAARQTHYGEVARAAGLVVGAVDTDALNEPGVFERFAADMAFVLTDADRARIEAARGLRSNMKAAPRTGAPAAAANADDARLSAEEDEVLALSGYPARLLDPSPAVAPAIAPVTAPAGA